MRRWEERFDAVLEERYAEEENGVLAAELGVSLRSVERHAAMLGLKKSAAFLVRSAKKASDAAVEWIGRMKASGKKIVKRYNGKGFEKGHHWDADVERKRVEKLREWTEEEKLRVLRCEKKRRGWLERLESKERIRIFADMLRKREWNGKSIPELEAMLRSLMDEVYALRQEIDRRKGSVPEGVDVDFADKYITK